jgi:hypothetical protein
MKSKDINYKIEKNTVHTHTLFLTAIVVNKVNCLCLIKEKKSLACYPTQAGFFYPFQNSCLVTKLLLIIKILTNVFKSVNWCQLLVRQHDVEKKMSDLKTKAAFLDH